MTNFFVHATDLYVGTLDSCAIFTFWDMVDLVLKIPSKLGT